MVLMLHDLPKSIIDKFLIKFSEAEKQANNDVINIKFLFSFIIECLKVSGKIHFSLII